MLVGYMRVSSDSDRQSADLQRDALLAAGVDVRHLFEDRASGTKRACAAALAGKADAARLCGADAPDLGARQPVRSLRAEHEHSPGVALIEMAAADTTACSTPCRLLYQAHDSQRFVGLDRPPRERGVRCSMCIWTPLTRWSVRQCPHRQPASAAIRSLSALWMASGIKRHRRRPTAAYRCGCSAWLLPVPCAG